MEATTNKNSKLSTQTTSTFKSYMQFDVPISLFPFLFHKLEKNFKHLIQQAQSRNSKIDKITLTLFCHENKQTHLVEVQLDAAANFYENLLNIESELLKIDLSNPICSIELVLFTQKRLRNSHTLLRDKINKLLRAKTTTGQRNQKHHLSNRALKIKPMDESDFTPLYQEELTQYSFISHKPMADSLQNSRGRDYYLAFDSLGNKVWIYFDHLERCYFKMKDCA